MFVCLYLFRYYGGDQNFVVFCLLQMNCTFTSAICTKLERGIIQYIHKYPFDFPFAVDIVFVVKGGKRNSVHFTLSFALVI